MSPAGNFNPSRIRTRGFDSLEREAAHVPADPLPTRRRPTRGAFMRPIRVPHLLASLLCLASMADASTCGSWKPLAVPGVTGATRVYLNDVAAISKDDAWAVGEWRGTGGAIHTLVMHWDGSSWTQAPAPDPVPYAGGTPLNALNGVVARAPDDVWAGGFQTIVANGWPGQQSLILHWDGSSWSEVPRPVHPARHDRRADPGRRRRRGRSLVRRQRHRAALLAGPRAALRRVELHQDRGAGDEHRRQHVPGHLRPRPGRHLGGRRRQRLQPDHRSLSLPLGTAASGRTSTRRSRGSPTTSSPSRRSRPTTSGRRARC